jgi:phytoene/squalene synthetase
MTAASNSSSALAASLTRAGSRQTYLTIRWLVDRDLVEDAFRAYAYFRWVDDAIDVTLPTHDQRLAFVGEQKSLMARLWAGDKPNNLAPEESLLADLIQRGRRAHTGLESYLRSMMRVIEFDARRRGRLISQAELDGYNRDLSIAVMDALSYFIGHRYRYPDSEARYHAVAAAHICHMLRDTVADVEAGYYNIPLEVLEAGHITPADLHAPAYRDWVCARVGLARDLFREGKRYIHSLSNLRARLAGLAYCARFESILDTIEGDGYLIRSEKTQAYRPAFWPMLFRQRSSQTQEPGRASPAGPSHPTSDTSLED